MRGDVTEPLENGESEVRAGTSKAKLSQIRPQIERIDRQAADRELFSRPCILAAVRVEAVDDDDHATDGLRRPPYPDKDLDAPDAIETLFTKRASTRNGSTVLAHSWPGSLPPPRRARRRDCRRIFQIRVGHDRIRARPPRMCRNESPRRLAVQQRGGSAQPATVDARMATNPSADEPTGSCSWTINGDRAPGAGTWNDHRSVG